MARCYTESEIVALAEAAMDEQRAFIRYAKSMERYVQDARESDVPESSIETRVTAMFAELSGQRTELAAKMNAILLTQPACEVSVGRPPLLDTCKIIPLDGGGTLIVPPTNAVSAAPFGVFDANDVVEITDAENSANKGVYIVSSADYNLLRNPYLTTILTGTVGTDAQPTYWAGGTWGTSWITLEIDEGQPQKNGFEHQTGNTAVIYYYIADCHIPLINGNDYKLTWTIANRTAGSVVFGLGDAVTSSQTASGNDTLTADFSGTTDPNTRAITITPTSDFDGKIYDIVLTPSTSIGALYLTETCAVENLADTKLKILLKER